MSSNKTIADVLRGVIDVAPSWANLLVVVAALLGMSCCATAAFRLYQAVQHEEATPMNWLAAFGLGAAMTIVAIVVGQSSLLFSAAE
jgi:hypothetical protein